VLRVLAFVGQNVSISSGNANGYARIGRHAARLIGEDGKLAFDRDTLQQVARATLIDVLSCRENRSDSGVAARIAGEAIGADMFLPNMATEDFLSCLSSTAIEAVCRTRRCFRANGSRIRARRCSALRREPVPASGRVATAPAPGEVRRLGRQTRSRRRRRGVRC
jgi:hypothetical protein